jgi:hypothetical protein
MQQLTNKYDNLAQQLANQIIAEQQQTQILARNGRTYTKFDTANDIISNQTETVTAGLWSDNLAKFRNVFYVINTDYITTNILC